VHLGWSLICHMFSPKKNGLLKFLRIQPLISITVKLKFNIRATRLTAFSQSISTADPVEFITFCHCQFKYFIHKHWVGKNQRPKSKTANQAKSQHVALSYLPNEYRYGQGPKQTAKFMGPQLSCRFCVEMEMEVAESRIICWRCKT